LETFLEKNIFNVFESFLSSSSLHLFDQNIVKYLFAYTLKYNLFL